MFEEKALKDFIAMCPASLTVTTHKTISPALTACK